MPVPRGTIFRIKVYPSGKRVRLAIFQGMVIETTELPAARKTKSSKRLANTKRRIGLK